MLLVKSTMDTMLGVIALTILKAEITDRKGRVDVMRLEAEVVALEVGHRVKVMMEVEEEDINQDRRITITITIKRVEADTVQTMTVCRVCIMPTQPVWLPKAIQIKMKIIVLISWINIHVNVKGAHVADVEGLTEDVVLVSVVAAGDPVWRLGFLRPKKRTKFLAWPMKMTMKMHKQNSMKQTHIKKKTQVSSMNSHTQICQWQKQCKEMRVPREEFLQRQ